MATPASTSASTLRIAKPSTAMIRPELASIPPVGRPTSRPTATIVATVNSVAVSSSPSSLGVLRLPFPLALRARAKAKMRASSQAPE